MGSFRSGERACSLRERVALLEEAPVDLRVRLDLR